MHIPFCRVRCSYCDFFSTVDQRLQESLISGMVLDAENSLVELDGPNLRTVYVGGGTPSLLRPDLLRLLLAWIAPRAKPGAEITLEANPESLSRHFLAQCEEYGVTRISLGIQSLDQGLLDVLGRGATERQSHDALDLLASRWNGHFSVDLLTGVPGQTEAVLGRSIEEVLASRPDHVSLYALTRETGTAYDRRVSEGRIEELSRDRQDELWLNGAGALQRAGYRHYEISNFALPGAESKHNRVYWALDPYLGVGPSAVSTLPGRLATVVRVSRPNALRGGVVKTEGVRPADFLFETMMMGLRLAEGVPVRRIEARFGSTVAVRVRRLWQALPRTAGARIVDERLVLSRSGWLAQNRLLVSLTESLPEVEDVVWPE
jgi:oxygen-independent coproporphyrinogen-3 oxidase